MRSAKSTNTPFAVLACFLALSLPAAAAAQEVDPAIDACLKAWGDHPFGDKPQYKTLDTSVKVFGIGSSASDTEATASPSLVLIKPIISVASASSADLLNPNAWYCLRTTVNLVGTLTLRVHCKAQLAAHSDGVTQRGDNGENRKLRDLGVTMISSTTVERPCN